jgi:PhoPQ-activated pathogenicity-related protein
MRIANRMNDKGCFMTIHQQNRIKRVCILCCLLVTQTVWGNPLENYIVRTEPDYRWQPTKVLNEPWGTIGHYELISQNWRGHTWTHHLVIVRPRLIRNPDIAFLEIAGDGNGENHINSLKTLAEQSGAVAAVLMNVPNQPLYEDRREDALIAYTFNQYLTTGDETWPLLFPMVKSAVKAMDAIQDIVKLEHKQQINRFVLSGASKRGWTTWLAAAVDKRIAAIAPMVIDTLNMKVQLQWSEQIYGKQSTKLKDYTELNLHRKIDNEAMQKLRSWIDPYAYIQRFTMPKLLLLGTNDPYWTVDSLRHYWNDLPEPKLIYQTPNAGHDLNGGDQALQTLAAFFELIADQKPLPKITWKFNNVAKTRINAQVYSNEQASTISLWTAHSDDRDFRDNQWTAQTLKITRGSSHAKASIPKPKSGYQAYLMEVELKTDTGHPYKLSTQAQVSPDTNPCGCWISEEK